MTPTADNTEPDYTNPTPQDWLDSTSQTGGYDRPRVHPDTEFLALAEDSHQRRSAQHEIATSLAKLRRAAGLNQTEVPDPWGHRHPDVSEIEDDPSMVELSRLAAYVRAIGGRLSITVEAGGHIYHEDFVDPF